MADFVLNPGFLTLAKIKTFWREPFPITLDDDAIPAINESSDAVKSAVERGATIYGINTGFGLLAQTRIPQEQLEDLQRSLVLSHATGTGKPLSKACVALTMLLKINSLARGHSGIRLSVIELLIQLMNARLWPIIPSKGSVGASGDLAPLAHLAGVLLGVGEVIDDNDEVLSATEALARIGQSPIDLAPKEGLALLNGTQVSTALALCGLFRSEDVLSAGIIAGALSVDASAGSCAPFDPRIHEVRGHQGQIEVAKCIRGLLSDSQILTSHKDCDKVQDPYSLRCQPQVVGACLDQIHHAGKVLLIEANAVSDNPLVFAKDQEVISGGNFHAEPVAMAADNLALAIAEIGAISERRIALMMDRHISGLPAFLVQEGGVNSGFMIAQVTAAALASENKSMAHPASVDSLPTSANQEDHVSMATFAARRLEEMAENTATVIGIELLAAAQGVEFRKPLRTSTELQRILKKIREKVPFYQSDRYFAPDIEYAKTWVLNGELIPTNWDLSLPSSQ